MSKRKFSRAFTHLIGKLFRLQKLLLRAVHLFLRNLIIGRRQPQRQAGFVLPTTALILLVVSIVIAALSLRSVSRTNQVIGERKQQVIYNAASPAVERAKAKLEYLFSSKGGLPTGIPPETTLINNLLDTTTYPAYTLPDETPLKLNGNPSNAWTFQDPATGNKIAYSILIGTNVGTVDVTSLAPIKSQNQIVRNAPVGAKNVSAGCTNPNGVALQGGWSPDVTNTAVLRKNFQIDAVVLNPNTVGQPAATLELVQERQLNQGNKWGAWFRNDLEVFAGPAFNWNGTMHTEGSFLIARDSFRAFLISSPFSCLFGSDGGISASDITMTQIQDANANTTFQGQLAGGRINSDIFDAAATIDYKPDNNKINQFGLQHSTDSVSAAAPAPVTLDPLTLFTTDQSVARTTTDSTNLTNRSSNWSNQLIVTGTNNIKGRVSNRFEAKPYVDDTYRADNRYGPKVPKGGVFPINTQSGQVRKVGEQILTTDDFTTANNPNYAGPANATGFTTNTFPANAPESVGLDGYWERRARNEGLRVIVGQRLELGKPLDLPTPTATNSHEALQRRTLRDDVAAVQSTAVYHYYDPNEPNNPTPLNPTIDPIACVATTVHPGTAGTLKRSATFQDLLFNSGSQTIRSDFFYGYGTNGWEYAPPASVNLSGANTPLIKALQNLAYYAGDPSGAYPATQDNAATSTFAVASSAPNGVTHPYPLLTQAGDFSNLRLALKNLQAAGYNLSNISPADLATLQTSACSLGMLAHEIVLLNNFSYSDASNLSILNSVNTEYTAQLAAHPTYTPDQIFPLLTSQSRNFAQIVYTKEQVVWDRSKGATYVCNIPSTIPTLQTKLCATGQKYIALYYIFPLQSGFAPGHGEERTDSYITDAAVNPSTNLSLYRRIDDSVLPQIELLPIDQPSNWTLKPQLIGTPPTSAPNYSQQELINYTNSGGNVSIYRVPFKDTALFNGREMMSVRVLDIDLDLLRQTKPPNTTDTWLPASGIVFAFREDAVREDGIARPANDTWTNYTTAWKNNYDFGPLAVAGSKWRMNATNLTTLQDPPVNSTNAISPKPIDYYPDPDRRPYGFRLKNGSDLNRLNGFSTYSGLSLISDQPVYIQADMNNGFNIHQNGGNIIEEFQQPLEPVNWSNFYDRNTLNSQFAKLGKDSWLPTAILADAISIISNNFCDGSIEDSFLQSGVGTDSAAVNRDQYGCTGGGNGHTSYLNQNRPSSTPAGWKRENDSDGKSPIQISPNGNPLILPSGEYSSGYYTFSDAKVAQTGQNQPNDSRINTVIVSGTVPSRVGESYGGFHNFPRFLENWGGKNLFISGSFIQLNFSSYATGAYDQDNWETQDFSASTTTLKNNEVINYYSPPFRRWGYDVALQYQPPGPVSRRFASISNQRSEFYKELPVDDAYIKTLRCAKDAANNVVDPNATCP